MRERKPVEQTGVITQSAGQGSPSSELTGSWAL
jgi:hypothetical protein